MVIGAGAVRLKVMVRVGCCSIQICGDNERVVDMIGCGACHDRVLFVVGVG